MLLRKTSPLQGWGTPDELYDVLNQEFRFDIDVCAEEHNTKVSIYFDEEVDGLAQPWFGTCWCNPPYDDIESWVDKALAESSKVTTVMLLPVRTDRPWFQLYAESAEIRFLPGRLKFTPPPGFTGKVTSSAFPCLLMIFGPKAQKGLWRAWSPK